MSVIAWIAVGLLGGGAAGWLAGSRGRPLLGHVVVGTLGAVLGGFIAAVTLGLDIADIDPTSVVVAAMGALVLVLVLRALPPAEVFD